MRLRVLFDPPGFFVNDPRLVLRVDDRTIYDGSFKSGLDVSVEVPATDHVLETAIAVGPVQRKQKIPLRVGPDAGFRDVSEVHAKISYSRFWGNFSKRAQLSAQG